MITMTLSAADATAHLVENPFVPEAVHGHNVGITLMLLALLGAIFLAGFNEAIGIAVALVATYLTVNLFVVVVSVGQLLAHPELFWDWSRLLSNKYPDPVLIAVVALLMFPKLALGLSGFETGVAVMPLVKGDPGGHRGTARGTDTQHPQAPDHCGRDHERVPAQHQRRDELADPPECVPVR